MVVASRRRGKKWWAAALWLAVASVALPVCAAPAGQDAATVARLASGIAWHRGGTVLQATALREGVVRIRIGRDGKLPEDASWAALAAARAASAPVSAVEQGDAVGFATGALTVTVARATGAVSVRDSAGHVLLRDLGAPFFAAPATGEGADGAQGFALVQAIPDDAHYFGLGDKFGPLDRLGRSYAMWNTDSYAYREGQDPLYKDIPFFIGYTGGVYWGLFVDNTWRLSFDFGHAVPGQLRIAAPGGPIDYYVMAGPDAKAVERRYAWLTGTPAMPPRWALGFQQSRWGYKTEADLRGVVERLRKERIPADAVWMDIDYQDHFRPFTVDAKAFPHFRQMVADFAAQGMHTVAITDLHVADLPHAGYAPYDEGMAQDRFVKQADGKPYVAPVWPGPTLFPEFTQAATRAWWGTLYRRFALEDGIAGFWNDMNEPAIFETASKTMPLDNRHRIDEPGFAPRTASHGEIHNVFGMLNHRATYEGLLAFKPGQRPFVMTRASYAGGQRYGVTWSGDNVSSWNHLKLTVPMLTSLGLGGFTFAGADIGGFAGIASPELLTRWYELAMFTPIARSHADPQSRPQEPWADGPQHEAIRRRYIEARYRLLPYNYALAEEAARTGVPMMRPLFMEFPQARIDGAPMDLNFTNDSEFMWGRALLVAPPPAPESPGAYQVILPPGGWYDYWSGRRLDAMRSLMTWGVGGQLIQGRDMDATTPHMVMVEPKLDQLPVYVRAGSIIPHQPPVQSTDEVPGGPLALDVYPGPDCEGVVYDDDGRSFGYRQGAYSRVALTCDLAADGRVTLRIGRQEGAYRPWWKRLRVVVHGLGKPPRGATLDGAAVDRIAYDAQAGTAAVEVPVQEAGGVLVIEPEAK
ncbi:glycoside hydrolase family 31 protein [Frateuria defendens]|uniref:glycoside hydrolase family 31 protein n=1 Tax=Frateuria defendens TaxID=2219559 RepID=UPI00066FE54D|nr:TIM-barrel domain-containing protein [Frateuria defendens]